MVDREKVIKGLQYCFATANCDGCPYEIECRKISFKTTENHCPILDDVLDLLKEQEEQIKNRDESLEKALEEIKWLRGMLKEQEPMVLTADELYLMEHQCVYLERRNSKVYSSEPSIVIGTSKALFCQYKYFLMRENKISDVRYSSDYNKETKSGWRCWSAKPTEEQMKEVPWE